MTKRNRTFGGVLKRGGIKHLISFKGGACVDKRECRLNQLHLAKANQQLAGTYSPEIPHVITRRRSSAYRVIHLTRVATSGIRNLARSSVVS